MRDWANLIGELDAAFAYLNSNNPVVKVEGRRPETLTTGLFVLSIPGICQPGYYDIYNHVQFYDLMTMRK